MRIVFHREDLDRRARDAQAGAAGDRPMPSDAGDTVRPEPVEGRTGRERNPAAGAAGGLSASAGRPLSADEDAFDAGVLTGHVVDFLGHPGRCPRCEHLLVNGEDEVFALTDGVNVFYAKTAAGWFCWNCPTVVINGNFYGLLVLSYGRPAPGRGYGVIGFCPGSDLKDLHDPEQRALRTLAFEELTIDSVHPWTWHRGPVPATEPAAPGPRRSMRRRRRSRRRPSPA